MQKNTRPVIELRAPVELKSLPDGQSRRFEIRAYTGKVISSWFGSFVIDIAGMRTKPKVPILREHERDRIVGWSEETRRDSDGLYLSGTFSSTTPDAKEVLALADEGFPWQASVGIKPLQVKILNNASETMIVNGKSYSGPLEVWTKTLVGETSMVSWGADNDTGMSLLSEGKGESVAVEIEGNLPKGDRSMNLEEFKQQHPELFEQAFKLGAESLNPKIAELTTQVGQIDQKLSEAKEAGITCERARCVKLLSAKADSDATLKAIKDGTSAAEAFEAFFLAEREGRAKRFDEVAKSLPESVGVQGKTAGKPGEKEAPDFMAEVKRYAEDHNCSEAKAVLAVQKKDPELHKAWLESKRGE
jgi:hypothetical protein